jgi:hypothetical protein
MAHVLGTEVIMLAKEFGIARIGFLTLTFADRVTTIREAQRRFHSLNTHVIKGRYRRAIGVWERQKSGRVHFHLAVVLAADIRSGADLKAFERGDYRSANGVLRSEWAFWRKTAPLYRFGRTELLPLKSTAEGAGRYMGKYISKHIGQRDEQDKGARVVRFIGYGPGDRRCSARFSWNTDNGWLWRHKVKAFCESHGMTFEQLRKIPRWAWKFKESIMAMPISDCFPSLAVSQRSIDATTPLMLARSQAEKILESKSFCRTYLLSPPPTGEPEKKTRAKEVGIKYEAAGGGESGCVAREKQPGGRPARLLAASSIPGGKSASVRPVAGNRGKLRIFPHHLVTPRATERPISQTSA